MVLALFVLALVSAPGLQYVVATEDFPSLITLPINVDGQQIPIQTLPALIEPEIEAMPLPTPEETAVNPCDSCFSYITTLIEQLADTTEIQPHPMPEAEVLPEEEVLPEFEILPHPMPVVEAIPESESEPEFSILPHEMPQVEVVPSEYLRS